MYKKIAAVSAALLVAASFSAPAFAHVSPAPTTVSLDGFLNLSQTLNINCAASLTLTINADGHTGSITGGSIDPGDWQCALVNPSNFPWAVTIGHADANGDAPVTISGLSSTSIAGDCSGNVSGTISSPGVIVLDDTIPGVPGPCHISGALVSSSSLTVS
ncbi:protein activator of alkane oxidation PraB [Brevundimonas naejangsanensis]|uniref:Protein activator of alkane oxidation PraB n=1 Tax=Brevundimonas naejangsanensis TaxID=588932 RepID=A0A494RFI3_9CAUL|nr:protein activator of alkane oxidation PraB [Brevundimonas naejangsanensis]AYG93873.1 protein activator of alkane oxidation PraB [Brevundimonas naejangsanensis]